MDIAPWPKDADQKIRDEAANANMPQAIEILDRLAKIVMGNAHLVEYYADIWDPRSVEALTDAQEEFATNASNVNDVWTGTAAEEFKAWALKFNNSLNDCKAALKGPRDVLWECSRLITETYKLAIELIGKVASSLVTATTGAVSVPFDLLGIIGDLLADFIDMAAKLIGEALVKMRDYRKAMADMRSAAARLTDLVPMGKVVADKEGWKVRPA
ncbi:hypothetical protein [Amycolatopsis anabasis]|uniref:hypothetical protein n=1 Tax=Amycolatopsis anabasis TaxID=1840409 RepID=UPI00131B03FC|nr:hypothetical protein [Amycolatopsis anabasis]